MSDEHEKTERGFNVYAEFVDSHGSTVRVQQSSGFGCAFLWIFTRNSDGSTVQHWKPTGGWEPAPRPRLGETGVLAEGWTGAAPHLSPADCRALIGALHKHLAYVEEHGLEDDLEDGLAYVEGEP